MHSGNPGQAASSRLAGLRAARGAIPVCVILFSLLALQKAAAHDPGLSSLTIRPRPNSLEATLMLAVKDAAQLAALDDDRDGIVTKAEFAQDRSQLEAVVATQLIVAPDGKLAKPAFIRSRLDENDNVEVHLDFGRRRLFQSGSSIQTLRVPAERAPSISPGARFYRQGDH